MTEWRKIEGWPYEVGDNGQVRRMGSTRPLRPGLDKSTGYMKVGLCGGKSSQRTMAVHYLVAVTFLGPRPKGYEINHIDTNKQNNAASNLEYLTRLDNVRHAQANGIDLRGERNGSAKLAAAQVIEARGLHRAGHSIGSLARLFHVERQTMSDAIKGVNWKHLKERQ